MERALRRNQRRRVPRVPVDLPVTVTWKKKNFPCHARQLSEFGILLASDHKELVGEDIRLKLDLDAPNRSLSLAGIVVYAIEKGIGVRFEAVSPEDQPVLKSYVQARGIGVEKPALT